MKKMGIVGEIYEQVCTAVVDICEMTEGWMKCNKQECVEARALLVHFLTKKGLSRSQISDNTGLTRASIAYHIKEFDNKKCYSNILKIQYLQIEKRLEKNPQ